MNEQSTGKKKAGRTRFFVTAMSALSLGLARTMETSEALQEWRNHQANNRHHVDQYVH